ncbi:MAG: hypothetical protein ACRDTZ_03825 [Pseudonocardiaceae bacterium]
MSGNSGIGFVPALGLLFIGLKLGGAISWPWLWVLAPLWAGFVVAIVMFVLVLAFGRLTR